MSFAVHGQIPPEANPHFPNQRVMPWRHGLTPLSLVTSSYNLAAGPQPASTQVARTVGEITPESFGQVIAGMAGMSMRDSAFYFIREVFGRLRLAARLDDMQRILAEWQPNLVLRETYEIASFVAAEGAGVPQAHVAIGLISSEEIAMPAVAEALSDFGLTESLSRLQSKPRLSHVPPRGIGSVYGGVPSLEAIRISCSLDLIRSFE